MVGDVCGDVVVDEIGDGDVALDGRGVCSRVRLPDCSCPRRSSLLPLPPSLCPSLTLSLSLLSPLPLWLPSPLPDPLGLVLVLALGVGVGDGVPDNGVVGSVLGVC